MVYRFDRKLNQFVHQVSFTLEKDRAERLTRYARQKKSTVSDVLRDRVAEWVDKLDVEPVDDSE